jgi:secondary thiamine-phosphate synthase enzyme
LREFTVRTQRRTEFIDITQQVQQAVSEAGVSDGACTVCIPHTTAGVTINENADPSVQRDILDMLNRLVPFDADYTHAEGNSAAHIKASLMGSSTTVIVENGRLRLGTWQGIYFCEFDGPRSRRVWVGAR